MTKFRYYIFISVFLFTVLASEAQDASEIIKQSEEKYRGVTSAYTELTLTIVRPKWDRKLSLKSWSKGNDFSMVLITYPANEKGTAFLKKEKDAWNWIPSIERTIKLSPSMMMQSWMGSDFTNDDFVRESSLVRDYTHELVGNEDISGKKCYKIKLEPKPEAAVVWGMVIVYVDSAEMIQMKSEMYDEDGELVKVMEASDIQIMDGRKIATKVKLVPNDNSGNSTEMQINKILFDRPLDNSFFTTQNMKSLQ